MLFLSEPTFSIVRVTPHMFLHMLRNMRVKLDH